MARKRFHLEMSDRMNNTDPRLFVDRSEIMKLTKVAKSWEFTCSFCFKKFPSAQAMGGHQNAHRTERLEEKRMFVRDPIGYRKRAYLRAMRAHRESSSSNSSGASNPIQLNLHAAAEVVRHELANFKPKIAPQDTILNLSGGGNHVNSYSINFQPAVVTVNDENVKTNLPFVVMNFLPPKELSLAESVGVVHAAEDAKGKRCIDIGGCEISLEKTDLTLKL